ncbi:TonB system transport protein ExbD [Campylobacter fetus]|uniref:TonB system transport protein ExbD n=1 Tax=Campylobacter fetus TaxID=196 RepID=UPI000818AD89|nr:TonB system transport protein ExbD [Campylobacter fetus]OCR91858.1 biopolymer transporter ExbD [Campylobacter fetus subsp. testudinum]
MIKLPKNEGLNIIPFIDIILVLLAIVLSISTFIAQGKIKVDLPQSQSAQNLEDDKNRLSIIIDKENKFYLDENEASIEDLKNRIQTLDPDTLVELKSDKDAKFSSFVVIVDSLKLKGHDKFQIVTEKEQ